jgi:hypothetical protein
MSRLTEFVEKARWSLFSVGGLRRCWGIAVADSPSVEVRTLPRAFFLTGRQQALTMHGSDTRPSGGKWGIFGVRGRCSHKNAACPPRPHVLEALYARRIMDRHARQNLGVGRPSHLRRNGAPNNADRCGVRLTGPN